MGLSCAGWWSWLFAWVDVTFDVNCIVIRICIDVRSTAVAAHRRDDRRCCGCPPADRLSCLVAGRVAVRRRSPEAPSLAAWSSDRRGRLPAGLVVQLPVFGLVASLGARVGPERRCHLANSGWPRRATCGPQVSSSYALPQKGSARCDPDLGLIVRSSVHRQF